MKIILATTQFYPDTGGVPRLLWTLYKHRPQDIDVRILTIRNPGPAWDGQSPTGEQAPVDWIEPRSTAANLPVGGQTSLRFFWRLFSMTLRWKPDLIFCGVGFPTAIIAAGVRLLTGVPLAVYTHSEDLTIQHPRNRRLLGWALNQAAAVITIARFSAEQLSRLGVTRPKIHIIPPGIEVEKFVPSQANPLTGAVPAAEIPFTLLTVARLIFRKGQDSVLRALPELRKSLPNVHYRIVGSGPDEPALRELAQELGVTDLVTFAGGVSDQNLPGAYQACDLFVMPTRPSDDLSEVEGFGIAYLEAAAAGKPVIAGRAGGTADAIEDGITGYLVDPTDLKDLTDRIIQLAHDPDLAARMGAAGRERILARFSAQAFAREVFGCLQQALPHDRARGI